MDYGSLLTTEQKKAILEQRIAQFANEAYQHDINRTVATATGNDEAVSAANEALTILDTALTIHQGELATLEAISDQSIE